MIHLEQLKMTLKAARVSAGLSQTEAARKIGVTKDTLGNWERGKTYPNALNIRRIEDVYGVRYDSIIFLLKDNA